jgi:hypothetical protein
MVPKDAYQVLELLESYHRARRDNYLQLHSRAKEDRVSLLLEHLAGLEKEAIEVIADERARIPKGKATYLLSGPTLTIDPAHAVDCRCGPAPTFDDAVWCALSSDEALDELIDRLAGSTPAASIQELASRLREFERTRERQIANFARPD